MAAGLRARRSGVAGWAGSAAVPRPDAGGGSGPAECGPRGEKGWAARLVCWALGLGFLSHFYFLSSILFPISNQTNTKLNSNKFEFKPP